ncbi:MAG: hypothetical protein ACKN9F_03465 [Methylomonas sp.]
MSEIILQKSSRLMAMRASVTGAKADAVVEKPLSIQPDKNPKFSPELLQARYLIDQRLAELLNRLPDGKQQRLFKIRYGFEPEQLKQQSLKQIFSKLEINPAPIKQFSTNHQSLWELNYNGEQPTQLTD